MNLLDKLIGHKRKRNSKAKQKHRISEGIVSVSAQDVDAKNKAIQFIIYGFFGPNKCIYPQILDKKTVESIFQCLRSEPLMQMIDNFREFTRNRPSDVELDCFVGQVIKNCELISIH